MNSLEDLIYFFANKESKNYNNPDVITTREINQPGDFWSKLVMRHNFLTRRLIIAKSSFKANEHVDVLYFINGHAVESGKDARDIE